jgi:hypothetical protein
MSVERKLCGGGEPGGWLDGELAARPLSKADD